MVLIYILLLNDQMFGQDTLQLSFEQLFDLYRDINSLDIWEVSDIIPLIVSQRYNNIVTFHRYGFIFYYFDQLVRGEISTEQFLTMGDIEGQVEDQINPHVYQEEYPALLKILTPDSVSLWDGDTLVILDPIIQAYYTNQYGDMASDACIVTV